MQKILLILLFGIFIGCSEDSETDKSPSNLTATQVSVSEVRLTWVDNADDETSFVLERSVNGEPFALWESFPANRTTFIDTGLVFTNVYAYRVIATVGSKNKLTDYSNTVEIQTIKPPTNLRLISSSQTTVKVSWEDNSDSEDGFYIERGDGTSYSIVDSVLQNITEYEDGNLDSNQVYFYRIKAYNFSNSVLSDNTLKLSYLQNSFSKIWEKEYPNIRTIWFVNDKLYVFDGINKFEELDIQTGNTKFQGTHISLINKVSVDNSNTRLLTYSDGLDLKIWNTETGTLIWEKSLSSQIVSEAISDDGNSVILGISSSVENSVKVMDIETGTMIWEKNLAKKIKQMLTSLDKVFVLSNSDITVYDINNGNLIWNLDIEVSPFNWSISKDGSKMICETESNNSFNLYCVNTSNGGIIWNKGSNYRILTSVFFDNSLKVFAEFDNQTTNAFDVNNGNQIWGTYTFDYFGFSSFSTSINENSKTISLTPNSVSYSPEFDDKNIVMLDFSNGNIKWTYENEVGFVDDSFSENGEKYIISDYTGKLKMFDVSNGSLIWEGNSSSFSGGNIRRSALNSDGTTLISGNSEDDLLTAWSSVGGWQSVE